MAGRQVDKTIPNLENATPGFLVDEIERLRLEQARAKYLEGIYKQALDARVTPEQKAGTQFIQGTNAIGNYRWQKQERVDTDAVKEYFKDQPEELKKVMKVIEFPVLTTNPNPLKQEV